MKEIQIFNSPQFGDIQVVGSPDYPLFRASDVCTALGYANGRKAVADHVDEADVTKRDIRTTSSNGVVQNREVTFVNESGLYALIFGSKLATAKAFKRWVTSEVLPAIRQNGAYLAVVPNETPEQTIARALITAQERLAQQTEQIELLEKLNAERERTIGLQQLVINKQSTSPQTAYTTTRVGLDVGMTAHELNVWLENAGVIEQTDANWHLTANYRGLGLMQPATISPNRPANVRVRELWTEKGREFIINLVNQTK